MVEADRGAYGPVRTERVVVTDPDEHKAHKAEYMRQWMSREGLECERKWFEDDSALGDGRCLMSPFVQDSRHGRRA